MCRNTVRPSLAMVVLLAFIGLVAAANISHAQNNQTRPWASNQEPGTLLRAWTHSA